MNPLVPRRPRAPLHSWLTALFLAVATIAAAAPRASAAPTATTPRSLALVDQTTTIRLGDPSFNLQLRLTGAAPNDTVVLEVFDRVTSTVQLGDILGGGQLPKPIDSEARTKVSLLDVDTDGLTLLAVPLQLPGERDRKASLDVREPGVYPLRVSLRTRLSLQPDDPQFLTWLVVADRSGNGRPVRVAWMWKLPAVDFATDSAAATSRAALARNAAVLATITQPVNVVANPAVLIGWRESSLPLAGDRTQFRQFMTSMAASDREVLTAPYADVDEDALLRRSFDSTYRDQLAVGAATLTSDLGLGTTDDTTLTENPNADSVAALSRDGITRVVVGDAALQPIDTALRHRSFSLGTGAVVALATTTDLSAVVFEGSDSAALRGQRFGAQLALTAGEHPGASIVLDPRDPALQTRSIVRTLGRVFKRNPFATVTGLTQMFDAAEPGTDGQGQALVRTFASRPLPRVNFDPDRTRELSDRLDGYGQLVGPRDSSYVAAQFSLLEAFTRTNTAAQSSHYLDRTQAILDEFASSVTVESRTVTITSERSLVPLAMTNNSGRDLRVHVRLESPKLSQINPDQVIELPSSPRNKTERIAVRVRGSGEFPVNVVVTSTDGKFTVGEPVVVTINSKVFGAYGTYLTYGALAFLVLWWFHHGWKRRRGQPETADA